MNHLLYGLREFLTAFFVLLTVIFAVMGLAGVLSVLYIGFFE